MRPPVQSSLRGAYPELFQFIDREECGLRYAPRFREFSLAVRPEDPDYPVVQLIHFCPFSGKALPAGLRNEFFDTLRASGLALDLGDLEQAPEEYQSEAWWIARSL